MEEEKGEKGSPLFVGFLKSGIVKAAHDDTDPLLQDKSLLESAKTGDACGFPVEPESELGSGRGMGTPVAVKQYSSKRSLFRRRSQNVYTRSSLSPTSSSKNKSLPAASSSSDPLCRNTFDTFPALMKTARDSDSDTDSDTDSDSDSDSISVSVSVTDTDTDTKPSLSQTSSSKNKSLPAASSSSDPLCRNTFDTFPALMKTARDSDSDTDSDSDSDSDSISLSVSVSVTDTDTDTDTDTRTSLSQTSSSKNKSLPAVSSSSDPQYNIFETFPALNRMNSDLDPLSLFRLLNDQSLCELSETGMMNNCSSAAASTQRDLTDNTSEVRQGSSTGRELREEALFSRGWLLKRSHSGQIKYSAPVWSAFSQAINPSDADLSIVSQSQAWTDQETLTHQYRDDSRSYSLPGEISHLPYRKSTDKCGSSSPFSFSPASHPSSSQSRAPPVAGPPGPQGRLNQYLTGRIAGSGAQDAFPWSNVLRGTHAFLGPESVEDYDDPIWSISSSVTHAPPGDNQDVAIEMEMDEAGSLSSIGDSYSVAGDPKITKSRKYRKYQRVLPDPYSRLPKRKSREDGGPRCKSVRKPSFSQSITPTVAEPLCGQSRPADVRYFTGFTEGGAEQDAFEFSIASELGRGSDVVMETMDAPVAVVNYTVTKALPSHDLLPPPWSSRIDSSCLSRSSSLPSLSGITSVENKTLRRAESLPDIPLRCSFEDFTPDMAEDDNDETYRFQCSCPGLYRCSVTGLLFHMAGEGDVVYRTVPWDRRLLARHRKKPAGPLLEIKCKQHSVRGLHLPHCEIRSTGGCDFLAVAHVKDDGVEFMDPPEITETHVVLNITGFSAFGNVKDEDSPPVPVRVLVLLFYRPPADPDPESLLNVLLLPRNVVLRDVLRIRKKLVGDESYIETSPHCKLTPEQEYTLCTRPEDDQVLVQPTEAEFDCDNYDNYFPSFQVTWETTLNHIKLLLRDANSSHVVWERRVCLSSAGARRSCGPIALDLPPPERLLDIRSRFVEGISGPVLKSLLDKLLEKTVMTDAERESADEMTNNRDKARFVIDTVRKKGGAAGSEMIEILCEADPFLCEHLGLI